MDMDDSEMLAAMGISGFGQKKKERTLDPNRFEKNRLEVRYQLGLILEQARTDMLLQRCPLQALLEYRTRPIFPSTTLILRANLLVLYHPL